MNSERFANYASALAIAALVGVGAYVVSADRHPDLDKAENSVVSARAALDSAADKYDDHREEAIKALDVALAQIRQAKKIAGN